MAHESDLRAFSTVMILALVCSLLVAGTAVGLRSRQEANRQLDRQKNILRAAGLYDKDQSVDILFAQIETRVVKLASGDFAAEDEIDPQTYNQLKAAWGADTGRALSKDDDTAGLGRLEKYSLVYIVKEDGKISQFILPVRGKGLWSTMYGYVAVDADVNTVQGVTFYEHGETPGLGGEIENPRWLAGFRGKKIYSNTGRSALQVIKGKVDEQSAAALHQVDGLSGATLTSKGVSNLLEFWFGAHGFRPFLKKMKINGGANG